jgi:hypothetical protein
VALNSPMDAKHLLIRCSNITVFLPLLRQMVSLTLTNRFGLSWLHHRIPILAGKPILLPRHFIKTLLFGLAFETNPRPHSHPLPIYTQPARPNGIQWAQEAPTNMIPHFHQHHPCQSIIPILPMPSYIVYYQITTWMLHRRTDLLNFSPTKSHFKAAGSVTPSALLIRNSLPALYPKSIFLIIATSTLVYQLPNHHFIPCQSTIPWAHRLSLLLTPYNLAKVMNLFKLLLIPLLLPRTLEPVTRVRG